MKTLSKKSRTLRATEIFRERSKVKAEERLVDKIREEKALKLSDDPIEFFRQILGFEPFAYQKYLIDLLSKNQFTASRWCRQSGKSWILSGWHLWFAVRNPDCYIGLVGPSWRQTKLNMRRINYFARKLPPSIVLSMQKTKLSLTNGTILEAFPNNPDTIRGPTLHRVWWDETNFTPNAEDLFDAILFTLGTTDGGLACSSTPWNTDSLFWKMCNHKDFSDFARSHVTWEEAMEPNGPLKKGILEKIRKQFGEDPARWRREMEAEWAEDEDVWLPQSVIVSCVGTVTNCGEDLQPFDPEKAYDGEFFGGVDFAQMRDYCVFSVIQRLNDRLFLRHLKIFQQPTKYAHVLGYIKTLQDRWGGFAKIRVDFTREGPSIISDMENATIRNAEGVNFSIPRKSEMANLLRQRMTDQRFFFPLITWEKPYRGDICSELNVERYELRKDGAIALSHPTGTHDDVFWSIALAVYGTVEMKAVDLESLRFG